MTQYFKLKTEKIKVIKLVFINFLNFFIDEKFFLNEIFFLIFFFQKNIDS